MNDIYKHALGEVHNYGIAMGWVHQGTNECDIFETLTNMAELDDNENAPSAQEELNATNTQWHDV